jgi:hypothetical protein
MTVRASVRSVESAWGDVVAYAVVQGDDAEAPILATFPVTLTKAHALELAEEHRREANKHLGPADAAHGARPRADP